MQCKTMTMLAFCAAASIFASPVSAIVFVDDGLTQNRVLGVTLSVNGSESLFIYDSTTRSTFVYDDAVARLGLNFVESASTESGFNFVLADKANGALTLAGLPEKTLDIAVTDEFDVGIGEGIVNPLAFGMIIVIDSVNGTLSINPEYPLIFDDNDRPYVDVEIKGETGSKTVRLLVDTGAEVTTVTKAVAAEVGLKDTGQKFRIKGATGKSRKASQYEGEIDGVGLVTFASVPRRQKVKGEDVVGVLGTDVLDRRFKLDTQEGKLTIFDATDKKKPSAEGEIQSLTLEAVPLPGSVELMIGSTIALLSASRLKRRCAA